MKDSQNLTRRDFSGKLLQTLVTVALLDTVVIHRLAAGNISPIIDHWAIRLNDMCLDLRKNSLPLTDWQDQVESLLADIPLEDILAFIDFDKLTRGFQFPDLGVNTRAVRFPKVGGLPENLAFYKKIFGVKKDRAIIPHGHKNMTSAHLVLRGEFALRHYDKIRDEPSHMIIRPTIDKTLAVGEVSSISDERNNVHWFRTLSETAFTLDVIVLDLGGKQYEIDNIDLQEAEKVDGGLLRARKLDVQTALQKYGKEHH